MNAELARAALEVVSYFADQQSTRFSGKAAIEEPVARYCTCGYH